MSDRGELDIPRIPSSQERDPTTTTPDEAFLDKYIDIDVDEMYGKSDEVMYAVAEGDEDWKNGAELQDVDWMDDSTLFETNFDDAILFDD